MANGKAELRELLERLPDDVSLEDIQYHIYVRQKLDRAIEEVENGRVLTQMEVEERMSKWLGR